MTMVSRSRRIASNDSGASGGWAGSRALIAPGAVCAITGRSRNARAVVRDPVDELVAAAAEFVGGHQRGS